MPGYSENDLRNWLHVVRDAVSRRVWANFKQKHDPLLLWHEHLDKKLLGGTLLKHIRR